MAEFSGDGSDSSIGVGEGVDNPVGGKKRSAPVRRRGSARSRGISTRAARVVSTTDAAADDDDEVGELSGTGGYTHARRQAGAHGLVGVGSLF